MSKTKMTCIPDVTIPCLGKDGFYDYRSAYYRASALDQESKKTPWKTYYEMAVDTLEHNSHQDNSYYKRDLTIYKAEYRWYDGGSPEYKIHKEMAKAMLGTSLNIDSKYLKLPYKEFVIRMPPVGDIQSILVSECEPRGVFVIAFRNDGEVTSYWHILPDGITLGDSLDHIFTARDLLVGETTSEKNRKIAKDVLRLVLATCFFATGHDRQQRFVTQDKPRNHHERRVLAKAQKCRTSEIVLPPKFTVGQDVVLPKFEPGLAPPKSTPEPTAQCAECKHPFSDHSLANLACAVDGDPACSCEEFDTGRHLERGHIRSGHLHWYATGPRKPGPGEKNDYVLKWVAPTIVRPDLPLAPVKSRIIKTPANKIVSAGESSS